MSAEAETPSAAWLDWQAITEDDRADLCATWTTSDGKIPGIIAELTPTEQAAWMATLPTDYLLHLTAVFAKELTRRSLVV